MEAYDLINKFTANDYPPTSNGRSEVPLEDIYSQMRTIFPQGWNVHVVASGFTPAGFPYVIVEVVVTDSTGAFTMRVPGAAEADAKLNFGFAGLLGMAVRNACLRHLGMGEELYQNRPEGAVKPVQSATTPQYSTRSHSVKSPWDGTKVLKSGKHQGKMWKELPENTVSFLAGLNPPNKDALAEMDRRHGAARKTEDIFEPVDF